MALKVGSYLQHPAPEGLHRQEFPSVRKRRMERALEEHEVLQIQGPPSERRIESLLSLRLLGAQTGIVFLLLGRSMLALLVEWDLEVGADAGGELFKGDYAVAGPDDFHQLVYTRMAFPEDL